MDRHESIGPFHRGQAPRATARPASGDNGWTMDQARAFPGELIGRALVDGPQQILGPEGERLELRLIAPASAGTEAVRPGIVAAMAACPDPEFVFGEDNPFPAVPPEPLHF
ncbi:hypothetical protein [Rhodocista pekingensis]|uniref:Uncharacterized protein n=1 Tax=Rhodocista pekingensis TaxID=201185 RepID=A0ABW2L0V6_9PROT